MKFSDRLKQKRDEMAEAVGEAIHTVVAVNHEERMAICEDCPSLTHPMKQCKECGCFMLIKTKLAGAKCPLGKW